MEGPTACLKNLGELCGKEATMQRIGFGILNRKQCGWRKRNSPCAKSLKRRRARGEGLGLEKGVGNGHGVISKKTSNTERGDRGDTYGRIGRLGTTWADIE